jgi:hypothetical protein
MIFTTESKLDRHIKYSDLHLKNVQKQKDAANVVTEPVIKSIADQVEGIHYKLLYSGSKFFWRTKVSYLLFFPLILLIYK